MRKLVGGYICCGCVKKRRLFDNFWFWLNVNSVRMVYSPLQAYFITKHKLSKLSLSLDGPVLKDNISHTFFFGRGETCLNYTQSSLETLHKQLFSRSLVHNFEKKNVSREGKGRSVGALWGSTSTYTLRTMLFFKKKSPPPIPQPPHPKKIK